MGLAVRPIERQAGRMDEPRHPNGPAWGWLIVGLIGLVVVVETVVLAVMASLLSFVLAIVVPVAVLVVVVLAVRAVRRNWVHAEDDGSSWEELTA